MRTEDDVRKHIAELEAQIRIARQLLDPLSKHVGLEDAVRNYMQWAISTRENCEQLERIQKKLVESMSKILPLAQLAIQIREHDPDCEYFYYRACDCGWAKEAGEALADISTAEKILHSLEQRG